MISVFAGDDQGRATGGGHLHHRVLGRQEGLQVPCQVGELPPRPEHLGAEVCHSPLHRQGEKSQMKTMVFIYFLKFLFSVL